MRIAIVDESASRASIIQEGLSQLPVRICPGVTAASAAAASLDRSLTLRGLARRLTFVTAHIRGDGAPDIDWQALSDPQSTLAIYMGKAAAGAIARELIAIGLPGETPGCPGGKRLAARRKNAHHPP